MVKNLPASPPVEEMQFRSLSWEEPVERKCQPTPVFLIFAWIIPWAEEPGRLQTKGLQESDMAQQLKHHHQLYIFSSLV